MNIKIATNADLNRRPFEIVETGDAEVVLVVPRAGAIRLMEEAAELEKTAAIVTGDDGDLTKEALRLGFPEDAVFVRKNDVFTNLTGSVSVPMVRGGIRLKDIEALLKKALEESWVADPVLVIDSDDGEIVPVPGDKDESGMTLLSLMRGESRTA